MMRDTHYDVQVCLQTGGFDRIVPRSLPGINCGNYVQQILHEILAPDAHPVSGQIYQERRRVLRNYLYRQP